MITSSHYWLLLALGVPLFWLLPARFRLGSLAAASVAYLASLDFVATAVMLAWTLACYLFAPWCAEGRIKRLTAMLVLATLGYLAYFKYAPALLRPLVGNSMLLATAVPSASATSRSS